MSVLSIALSSCVLNPDQASQQAIIGAKVGGHKIRLTPFTVHQAPPKAVRTRPTLVLPAGKPVELRINCGMDLVDPGWQYRDEQDRIWLADRTWHADARWGAIGGGATVRPDKYIELPNETPLQGMYRAERYAPDSYRFRLPPGRYDLRLHFMETYEIENAKPGRRVFDVMVQGQPVLQAFDPVTEAGPARPVVREFRAVEVKDELLIEFSARTKQPAMINGIEILGHEPLAEAFAVERGDLDTIWDGDIPEPPGPVVGRYLCGVANRAHAGYELVTEYGDNAVWQPDYRAVNGFWAMKGGAGQRHTPIRFANTPVPQVLRHERFGGEGYEFKIPEPGNYAVRLHFAEGFEGNYKEGLRVFNVEIEGRSVLADFDPVKAGGGFAHASIFDVRGIRVDDAQLSIRVTGQGRFSKATLMNAVEIFQDPQAPAEMPLTQIVGPAVRLPIDVPETRKRVRALYVGNSHTFFWAIPETVAAMVNTSPAADLELIPYRFLHGGRVLSFFAHRIPGRPSALDVLEAGRYDLAVLQLLPKDDAEFNGKMFEALRTFIASAAKVDTRIMLYVFNPLSRMDDASRTQLLELAQAHKMLVVPFGDVRAVMKERLSEAPLPLDTRGVGPHLGFHPAYLDVCTHYAAWTGKSPVGHPTPTLVGQDVRVDPVRAEFLQRLAWEVYQEVRQQYGLRSYWEQDK